MKIVLINMAINSPYRGLLESFPMGLLNVATILRQEGNDCSILDVPWLIQKGEFSKDDFRKGILNKIKCLYPEMIGFYTRCDILPIVISMAKNIKSFFPNISIFLGGPGSTFVPKDILESFKFIDLIFLGESEVTLQEVFNKGCISNKLHTIKGLSFRKNNKIITTSSRPLIDNLDNIPLPDYQTIKYYGDSFSIAIEAGRGCPYNCNFCSTSSFWKREYRTKSPKRIVEEMKIVHKLFSVNQVTLIHDNLLVSENFIDALTNEISNEIPFIKWRCSGRVDNLSTNIIKKLRSSGCEGVFLGIETGSQKLQKSIGKNLELSKIENTINDCNKAGLNLATSFIMGFPEEDLTDLNDTIMLAIKTRQFNCVESAQLHLLSPNPGANIMNSNKELQLPNKFSDHTTPCTEITQDEMYLIKKFPNIFSSFYEFKEKILKKDLSIINSCCQNFLRLYPKTLGLLLNKVNLLKLFELITNNCSNSDKCACNYFENSEHYRICNNFGDFICNKLNLLESNNEILIYEQTVTKLLLTKFRPSHIIHNYKLSKSDIPKLSTMISIINRGTNIYNNSFVSGKISNSSLVCIRDSESSVKTFIFPPKASLILNLVDGKRTYEDIFNITKFHHTYIENVFIKLNELGFWDLT